MRCKFLVSKTFEMREAERRNEKLKCCFISVKWRFIEGLVQESKI